MYYQAIGYAILTPKSYYRAEGDDAMTDYQDEECDPLNGLKTEEIADHDLHIVTDYCLACPCGRRTRERQYQDGFVSFECCPRAEKYHPVYHHPHTGEHYQRRYYQPPNLAVPCAIAVAATRENIYIPLKELLIIPKGWILEVEEDKDGDNYLNLDMEMTLHRIPDQTAFDAWNQDVERTRKEGHREEEIARLRERLAQLIEEPLQGEGGNHVNDVH